jgi:hypothetical protein
MTVPNDNGHDVESDVYGSRTSLGEPRRGEPPQTNLLGAMNGLRRFSPAVRPARLHLAENHEGATPRHEIEFAALATEIKPIFR